ncbi:MAG TPA: 3-deoxy-D-manno-octulosonic acid kinase [Burkholderiales bacterium]
MNAVSVSADGDTILYDAGAIDKIDARFFDPAYWRASGRLVGEARGRGSTWIVRHGERDLVLRHYRRGGVLGPWLVDRYLWLGLARTRAVREWTLLAELCRQGLPVPRPVAVRVHRTGLCYRADLVTERIAPAESLADRLAREPLPASGWRAIGACIRRFHDFGVWHADLNAHNVLLAASTAYLLDFDRGRRRRPGAWRAANLARLRRSLDKLARQSAHFRFDEEGWQALCAGYDDGASAGQSSPSAAR